MDEDDDNDVGLLGDDADDNSVVFGRISVRTKQTNSQRAPSCPARNNQHRHRRRESESAWFFGRASVCAASLAASTALPIRNILARQQPSSAVADFECRPAIGFIMASAGVDRSADAVDVMRDRTVDWKGAQIGQDEEEEQRRRSLCWSSSSSTH
uniref:Uncharacterized protein n=1 Tax=Plectus sambesii TaxID=2011161 RepID=A0A914WZ22_9BILA